MPVSWNQSANRARYSSERTGSSILLVIFFSSVEVDFLDLTSVGKKSHLCFSNRSQRGAHFISMAQRAYLGPCCRDTRKGEFSQVQALVCKRQLKLQADWNTSLQWMQLQTSVKTFNWSVCNLKLIATWDVHGVGTEMCVHLPPFLSAGLEPDFCKLCPEQQKERRHRAPLATTSCRGWRARKQLFLKQPRSREQGLGISEGASACLFSV